MAERPKGTWVSQIFNFFPNNGLPIGLVDVVYNKDGSIAGYEVDGKFYKLGVKADKATKEKKATDPTKFGEDFAAAVAAKNKAMDEQREENLRAAEIAASEKTRAELKSIVNQKQNYIQSLRNSLPNYESVIERYATKIARGDELDKLEQDELKDAQQKYTSVMNTINEVQQDIFTTIYPNQKKKVDTGRTPLASAGPTGSAVSATETPTRTVTTAVTQEPKPTGPVKEPTKKKPTGKKESSDVTVSTGFSPAAARAGEEASMGGIVPTGVSSAKRSFVDLLKETEFWYDLPDYIFKLDMDPTTGEPGEMGKILVEAINGGWDENKFLSKIRLTKWWQANSKPIRERIISRAKYNELLSSGQDVSKTEYALDSAAIKRSVQSRARTMGANLDENAINQIVSRIYDGFLENDTVAIDSFIAPYIGKVSSIIGSGIGIQPTGYTGEALRNYQTLQAVAKANGFKVSDILPRLSVPAGKSIDDVVLQKLATGELDINRLAQDARNLAAQGQPDYVKGLLQQGYDLEQIFAPYKNVMGGVLELNPDEIDLNDATLRSAIGQDKEMNLFDFKRALRKDSRWQYTEGAREEVANSVLGVLRDFGFQG